MQEYLTTNAYGPDGSFAQRGSPPPKRWPPAFLRDLREQGLLVSEKASPALAVPLDDLDAAWEQVRVHDPDDVLAATAMARVRHAAAAKGRRDIAHSPAGSRVPLAGRVDRARTGVTP